MAKSRKKPSRKRVSKEWLRRSIAAKRGWHTRRKKAIKVERAKLANANKALSKKGKKKKKGKDVFTPKRNPKTLSVAQLKKQLAAEKKKRESLEKKFAREVDRVFNHRRKELDDRDRKPDSTESPDPFANFVDTLIGAPEWLHRDGTLAIRPSRLRWADKETYDELVRLLGVAKEQGDEEFEFQCEWISELYDVAYDEVVTLYYSP